MLVDSHCHLNYEGLSDQIPAVLTRAEDAGVSHMVCICSRLSEFGEVSAVAEAHEGVYCSVGIHPHDVESEPETDVGSLVDLANHPKTIGIGETGLDFYHENSPRDAQERNFRKHIHAARATGLPLIVHTRDADDTTIGILREEAEDGSFPGLIHCFAAGKPVADCALDLGLYISLSGIITFKNAEDIRTTVKTVPLDRILVETDSPFLAPIPHRGKANEPAYVVHTAQKAAEIFGVSFGELASATTDNFFRLFTKAVRH